MKSKLGLSLLVMGVIVAVGAIVGYFDQRISLGGTAVTSVPQFIVASSTSVTVTTTSKQLLATSSSRVAATIQNTNCTAAGTINLNANRDVVATANTGPAVMASTTFELKQYPNLPVPRGAVQGIASVGTCTVLVTEWNTQYAY